MTVTPEQAKAIAQQYLASSFSGTSAGDVDTFYGYYNVDVLSNGNPFGMLSVNGYSGQVWYHSWHGSYIQTATISEPTPVPESPYALATLMMGLALVSILVKVSPRKRTGIPPDNEAEPSLQRIRSGLKD
jgi:hypothetical protein